MNIKDQEYILWLCKRLVNKYKESPEAIRVVENILNENEKELSFYKNAQSHIDRFIDITIKNLSELKNYSVHKQQKTERLPTIVPADDIFEDINFNNLFVDKDNQY
jgi:hypothetical protein